MANLDITVARGADWVKTPQVAYKDRSPVNIGDGTTWVGLVKNPNATEDTVAATFSFDILTDGTDGYITISLPAAQTLLLRKDRLYEYEIFATILTKRYRVLWGKILFQPTSL